MAAFHQAPAPTTREAPIQDALRIAREFSSVQFLDDRERYLRGLVKIIPPDGFDTFHSALSYGLASLGIKLVIVKYAAKAGITPASIVESFISSLRRYWKGEKKRSLLRLRRGILQSITMSKGEVELLLDECGHLTREALGSPFVVLFCWDRVPFTLEALHLAQTLRALIRVTTFPWCVLSTSWILLPFVGETPTSVRDFRMLGEPSPIETPRSARDLREYVNHLMTSGGIYAATRPGGIIPMELYDVSNGEWHRGNEITFGTLPGCKIMLRSVWDKPIQVALYTGDQEYIMADFSRWLDVRLFPHGTSSRPDWGKWLISWPDLDVELNLSEEISTNVKEVNLFTVQVQPKSDGSLNPYPFTVVPRKSVARLQILGLPTGRMGARREFILVTR